MNTFAVTNHKGGSAKTTTAVNLAAALGEQGFQVLVVDMDPQGSATGWLGSPVAGRIVLDAYMGQADLAAIAVSTSAPGVQLIPSSPWLVAADRRQETDLALGVMRTLEALPPRWDYVFVDCPPSQGYLAIAPLSACEHVIVPVEAHVLALSGLVSLLETMHEVRERLNPALTLSAIVACRVSHTRHAREVVERLRERYPGQTLRSVVRENISLAEAPSFQLPITRYAPFSAGAEDYRTVAREFLQRQSVQAEVGGGSSLARLLKSAQRHAPSMAAWTRGQGTR